MSGGVLISTILEIIWLWINTSKWWVEDDL